MSFTVSGFVWYNNTDMDFYLDTGYTLHISEGGDLSVSQGVELPDNDGGILTRRRRLNPWLVWGALWAVRDAPRSRGGHPRQIYK